jgi:signal peptidase I
MRKNKKLLTTLVIVGGLLIGLYIVGRVTHAINFFKVPTGANIPGIKPGDGCMTTNLVTPKRFDFITYYYNNPREEGKRETRVHRLCGMPGDNIQMKDGRFFVNGQTVDDSLDLSLYYLIPENNVQAVAERFKLDYDHIAPQGNGKAMALLTTGQTKELTTLKIPFERFLIGKTEPLPGIAEKYNQPWTLDDFGPITVPKEHYFVMGDNRYQSEDSRFIGFIPKKDQHSVVIDIY